MSDRKGFDFGKLLMAGIIVIIFVLFLMISRAFSAPVVTLTASPASGPAPLTTTLTWNATGADTCRRGIIDVPLSGSVQITGVVVDTQYTVTCTSGKNYSDVTWTAPTEMLTGVNITAPIPATGPDSLAGYRLLYGTNQAALSSNPPNDTAPNVTPVDIPDKAALSFRVLNQPNGTYYYRLSAYNASNQYSDYAGPVNNTILVESTSATVLLDVQSFSTYENLVYNVVKKTDGFSMIIVGTIPLNTPCIKTQTVNGYYAVPSALVTWSGSVRSIVVVAKCKDQ